MEITSGMRKNRSDTSKKTTPYRNSAWYTMLPTVCRSIESANRPLPAAIMGEPRFDTYMELATTSAVKTAKKPAITNATASISCSNMAGTSNASGTSGSVSIIVPVLMENRNTLRMSSASAKSASAMPDAVSAYASSAMEASAYSRNMGAMTRQNSHFTKCSRTAPDTTPVNASRRHMALTSVYTNMVELLKSIKVYIGFVD